MILFDLASMFYELCDKWEDIWVIMLSMTMWYVFYAGLVDGLRIGNCPWCSFEVWTLCFV